MTSVFRLIVKWLDEFDKRYPRIFEFIVVPISIAGSISVVEQEMLSATENITQGVAQTALIITTVGLMYTLLNFISVKRRFEYDKQRNLAIDEREKAKELREKRKFEMEVEKFEWEKLNFERKNESN